MSPRRIDRKTATAGIGLLVFVVVTAIATTGLALTIANVGLGDTHEYSAVFSDVTGVEVGDDVRIAGVRVGEVRGIDIVQDEHAGSDELAAEVAFTVDADQELASSTHAMVRYRNLVGQRYIALTDGPGSPDPLPPGSTIGLSSTSPALDLTVLFDGFKPLFAALSPEDVNQLSHQIIQVLQGEAGTVEGLLASTASLTATLADRDEVIGDLIDNLNGVLETVAERDEQLSNMVVELQRFVSGLAEDADAIGASLDAIVALQRDTADLLVDGRPDLATDIERLGEVAGTLDDHADVIERTLQNMPGKLNLLTGTATYGSWFNFYLCDFEGRIVLPDGAELTRVGVHSEVERCRR